MADRPTHVPLTRRRSFRIGGLVVAILVAAVVIWMWMTAGRESTDDAQVDGHITQISARVGGTVLRVKVDDNQEVPAGAVLVELDPRDYEVAFDKANAQLADAEAAAAAARTNVPITSATATSNVTTAFGSVEQAQAATDAAQREVDAARARLATAQARRREADANAAKAAKDVDRLRTLIAKDEVSQQQFDTAVTAADAAMAAADSVRSQVAEAETGILVAESRLAQAHAGEQQARAGLKSAQTAPEQIAAMRARAASADAHVQEARATRDQAALNREYTVVMAPRRGIVSRKAVEVGQVIQAGQPLMALTDLEDVWITANFKETQLTGMRPGQRADISVDAYGKTYRAHVDSIAAATGARFSVLPPENATGNFVKVVQRVPVKIVLERGEDPGHRLRPGLSVEPIVYTR